MFSATAEYWGFYVEGEYRIDLAANGLGEGTLRGGNVEAITEAFANFIDRSMTYEESLAMEAFAATVGMNEDYEYEWEEWA